MSKKKWGDDYWDWHKRTAYWFSVFIFIILLIIFIALIVLGIVEDENMETLISNILLGAIFVVVFIVIGWCVIELIKINVEKRRSKIRVDTSLVKLSKRNQNLKLVLWVMVTIGILLLVWAVVWAINSVIKYGEINKSIGIPFMSISGLLIMFGGIGLKEIKDIRYESALKIPKKIFKINELVELRLIG
ncbi:MAG: hypothetical protein ACW98D_11665, partial [Promethearchaeota archaeon]